MQAKAVDKPEPAESLAATAAYISTLTEELAQMARNRGLDSLGYILEMARMEADQIVKSADEGCDDAQ
jgi:hypothetical protein